jgi:ABC-2 type transport system permease protein
MTSTSEEAAVPPAPVASVATAAVELHRDGDDTHQVPSGLRWLWRDSWTEALRHIRAIPRNVEQIIFATIQPIMFVLLFVYVFGGEIQIPGYDNYKQYLVPGIFAQTVLFGTAFTGVGVAEDVHKGIIDRLRSLPMNQAAVLIGRTISDMLRNIFTFAVMAVVAFIVGFRASGGVAGALGATLLLLAFSYAFSWIQALIGLSVDSVEAANSAGFIWMFPLTFVSSAFVSTATMPELLGRLADLNPFTKLTNASRALYNGYDPGADLWIAIAWAVGITVVFATLSARRFSRTASR